jgi:hypothetical protein
MPPAPAAWPLPARPGEDRRVSPAFALSSIAGNSSLGIAALVVGAGAFGLRYRSSVK